MDRCRSHAHSWNRQRPILPLMILVRDRPMPIPCQLWDRHGIGMGSDADPMPIHEIGMESASADPLSVKDRQGSADPLSVKDWQGSASANTLSVKRSASADTLSVKYRHRPIHKFYG